MDKQTFLNNYIVDRQNTNSTKWDGMQEKFGESGLISMWIADMEFKTCDAIVDAMTARCQHGVFGYSLVPQDYYKAFSDWMETRYQFPIEAEWVRFSTGCVTAISWMIHAFTNPGDACMILTPVYYPFYNVVTNNNRRLVNVDLHYENGYFTMDYAAIEQAIVDNRVKMFVPPIIRRAACGQKTNWTRYWQSARSITYLWSAMRFIRTWCWETTPLYRQPWYLAGNTGI